MKNKRRTVLYIPGNTPAMLQQGGIYGADSLLFDLEDAVALSQKDSARILVRNALKTINFYSCEVSIRVNHIDTPFGEEDLREIIPLKPDVIRIPKTESIETLQKVIDLFDQIEAEHQIEPNTTKIHAMIETALGIQNVYDIAKYSDRVTALTLGGQDLAADMKITRSTDGVGIDYARKRVVMAAKANKLDVIDTVFADVEDEEGLREETKYIKKLGFTGKAVINPRQIDIVNEVFMPSEIEIARASRIYKAFFENKKKGIGVFAVDGKMVDAPVMERAKYVLEIAEIDLKKIIGEEELEFAE